MIYNYFYKFYSMIEILKIYLKKLINIFCISKFNM